MVSIGCTNEPDRSLLVRCIGRVDFAPWPKNLVAFSLFYVIVKSFSLVDREFEKYRGDDPAPSPWGSFQVYVAQDRSQVPYNRSLIGPRVVLGFRLSPLVVAHLTKIWNSV
jgi:hypothetical protein